MCHSLPMIQTNPRQKERSIHAMAIPLADQIRPKTLDDVVAVSYTHLTLPTNSRV